MTEFAVEKAGKKNFLIREDGKRLELFCLNKPTADRVASALVHQNDSGLEEMEISAATRAQALQDACKAVCEGCRKGWQFRGNEHLMPRGDAEIRCDVPLDGDTVLPSGRIARKCKAQSIRALADEEG